MTRVAPNQLIEAVAGAFDPITGSDADFDPLIDLIGEAPLVLLGEATHGSTEFYAARARITQRLTREKGFAAVAVEADWPDAYRVNRFVRGEGHDASALDALGDFRRFPLWMWRNEETLRLVEWLHGHNAHLPRERRVGFYGLDLYSLYASVQAVIDYLDRVDPKAAQRARDRYSCLDHVGDEAQAYGHGVSLGLREPCEEQVLAQLADLRERAADYLRHDGLLAVDEQFFAEQNARVVRTAEVYYREMFAGNINTWNLRDRHMAETLGHLINHLNRLGRPAKVVVWAHNSHLGDASATDMARRGETNVGELIRRAYREEAVLVGFTTHVGSVSAASEWDGAVERKEVRPSRPDSWERLFHETGAPAFFLRLRDVEFADALREPRLQRAIGVIYRPQTELASHYYHARLADQFDAVIHFDETTALRPLDDASEWETGVVPETFPFGV